MLMGCSFVPWRLIVALHVGFLCLARDSFYERAIRRLSLDDDKLTLLVMIVLWGAMIQVYRGYKVLGNHHATFDSGLPFDSWTYGGGTTLWECMIGLMLLDVKHILSHVDLVISIPKSEANTPKPSFIICIHMSPKVVNLSNRHECAKPSGRSVFRFLLFTRRISLAMRLWVL